MKMKINKNEIWFFIFLYEKNDVHVKWLVYLAYIIYPRKNEVTPSKWMFNVN